MPDMESVADFIISVGSVSLTSTGVVVVNAGPVPRNARLIKVFVRQVAAWDGSTIFAIRNVTKGVDLSDLVSRLVTGAANDVFAQHFREEANNAFAAGDVLGVNISDASAGGAFAVTFIFRPL